MRPAFGPIVSITAAQQRIWSHAEVRSALGLTREPSLVERLLVIPGPITITDTDTASRARTERRWMENG